MEQHEMCMQKDQESMPAVDSIPITSFEQEMGMRAEDLILLMHQLIIETPAATCTACDPT